MTLPLLAIHFLDVTDANINFEKDITGWYAP